jgi:outer membrane biosynthesis protein TonB
MSMERQVCVSVKQSSDMNNPAERAWVEKCEQDALAQGVMPCTAASTASVQIPLPGVMPIPPSTGNSAEEMQREFAEQKMNLNAALAQARQKEQEMNRQLEEASREANTALQQAQAARQAARQAATTESQGSLDRSAIQNVVQARNKDIRQCYENRLALNPKLQGAMTVKIVISASGPVKSAQAENSTLNDSLLETCVQQVFLSMVFPPSGGDTTVTYPIRFAPE